MENCKKLRPIDLTITSGTSVIITVPEVFLKDGKFFDLPFCLTEALEVKFHDLTVGTETVLIQNGVAGTAYVMTKRGGNIFYADRLRIGYCYRIQWNNNGPVDTAGTAGGVQHFENYNTPCCARPYNPANTAIPTADAETEG